MKQFAWRCPTVPAHGALLRLSGSDRWYCPHHGHVAVGGRPATRCWFTDDELVQAAEAERRKQ